MPPLVIVARPDVPVLLGDGPAPATAAAFSVQATFFGPRSVWLQVCDSQRLPLAATAGAAARLGAATAAMPLPRSPFVCATPLLVGAAQTSGGGGGGAAGCGETETAQALFAAGAARQLVRRYGARGLGVVVCCGLSDEMLALQSSQRQEQQQQDSAAAGVAVSLGGAVFRECCGIIDEWLALHPASE